MKMQAKLLTACSVLALSGVAFAQGYYGDSMAAMDMQNTMTNQNAPGMGGPPPVPGQVGGIGNPAAGFNPGAMGGNTAPGMDPGMMGGDPLAMGGMQGQQTGITQSTPIPTEDVMVGRRVYDAVSGGLLEDAIEIAVRASDAEAYADDGVNDNGIAGDGIRGSVNTSTREFIGPFSNTMKSYLVHAVSNAEQIDPMVYYGYYVAKVNPQPVEGLKRYGLPLPGEQDDLDLAATNVEPDFPSILDLESDRDELVRRWNYEFLADYRVVPNDPQSEYFPVFIPSPPLTPANYPVPTGYVAPQAGAIQSQRNTEAAVIQGLATQEAAPGISGGLGAGGGMI